MDILRPIAQLVRARGFLSWLERVALSTQPVERARFESLRRSLFAPDWHGRRSVAVAAFQGQVTSVSGADRVRL